MAADNEQDEDLEALRAAGERRREVLAEIFDRHHERLRRMLRYRIDPNLRQRIDESDVMQEAFVEADRRLDAYLEKPDMPFFLWLRFIAGQEVTKLYRHHVATKKRDVRRQVSVGKPGVPAASTLAMADALIAMGTSPSAGAARVDIRGRLEGALDQMEAHDREVLVLRHFEGLSNGEVAAELEIHKDTASKRYVRALERLRTTVDELGIGETNA